MNYLKKYLSLIFFHVFVHWEIWGIHILDVVARLKACKGLGLFSLSNASDVNLAFLRENKWGKPWNSKCKYYIQIRIFSSPILKFCIKSIKLTSIIHNWNESIFKLFWHTFFLGGGGRKWPNTYMYYLELKWIDESSGESGMESSLLRYLFFVFLVT